MLQPTVGIELEEQIIGQHLFSLVDAQWTRFGYV